MIRLSYFLTCTIALYLVGIYCLTTKRNMIRLVLGIEILINAANLNFIVFSTYWKPGFTDPFAHSIVIISIALAGCTSAVALLIVIYAYRHYGTLDIQKLKRLKG